MQPRVYKTEHLPGLTRADLHEMMVAYGMLEFERRGNAPFMWIIKTGPILAWIETPWESQHEKNAATFAMRQIMKAADADAYSFMCEAWQAVEAGPPPEDLSKVTLPSQRPKNERDDVLMINTIDTKGNFNATRFLVTIRERGLNYLGPRDDMSLADMTPEGPMWNLLK